MGRWYVDRQLFGQVMSPHHSDHMSQRSQVSRIALLGCSLMEVDSKGGREVGRYVGRKIFLVRSCLLITRIFICDKLFTMMMIANLVMFLISLTFNDEFN